MDHLPVLEGGGDLQAGCERSCSLPFTVTVGIHFREPQWADTSTPAIRPWAIWPAGPSESGPFCPEQARQAVHPLESCFMGSIDKHYHIPAKLFLVILLWRKSTFSHFCESSFFLSIP
jgi:hypothetical protein